MPQGMAAITSEKNSGNTHFVSRDSRNCLKLWFKKSQFHFSSKTPSSIYAEREIHCRWIPIGAVRTLTFTYNRSHVSRSIASLCLGHVLALLLPFLGMSHAFHWVHEVLQVTMIYFFFFSRLLCVFCENMCSVSYGSVGARHLVATLWVFVLWSGLSIVCLCCLRPTLETQRCGGGEFDLIMHLCAWWLFPTFSPPWN